MNGCEGRERLGANYNQRSAASNLPTAAPLLLLHHLPDGLAYGRGLALVEGEFKIPVIAGLGPNARKLAQSLLIGGHGDEPQLAGTAQHQHGGLARLAVHQRVQGGQQALLRPLLQDAGAEALRRFRGLCLCFNPCALYLANVDVLYAVDVIKCGVCALV